MPRDGERVAKGKPLFDIETDKATMEIESPADGTLGNVLVKEGESSPVGQAVAFIFADGEALSVAPSIAAQPKAEIREVVREAPVVAAPGAMSQADGVRATPLARRLAREAGVALGGMRGSGPHGRIVAEDVRKAGIAVPVAAEGDTERIPLDGMRRTIAERLTLAKQTVPHFYLRATCAIDALLAIRERLNLQAPKDSKGFPLWKLSINDFVIKALALSLQKVPAANVTWGGDCIIRHKSSDIAVAVAVEGGLFTPVIRNAEAKSLSAVAIEMKDLAARARQRKLAPAEYQGGSASISNLGMYGIEDFTAIINPPQATILAVGAAVEAFVPVNGQPMLKTQMSCTLSCDHRAVDGAIGAELLGAFRKFVEDPALMLA